MNAKRKTETKHAKTRIFLVDDHPMLRKGIADCIRSEPDLMVCGQAGSAMEALPAIARERPDVVIVDISLPGRDGIELIKDIVVRHPAIRVLVLSMHDETYYADRAVRAGARGYLMKTASDAEVIAAIRQVMNGEIVFGKRAVNRMLERFVGHSGRGGDLVARLTDRELQVFRLLGEGHSRSRIAAALCLSVKTIEAHRANIRQKLGLQNATQLLHQAIEFSHEEAAHSPPKTSS